MSTFNIQVLLSLQEKTNIAYMGEDWRKTWNINSVRQSIHREYAEFLDEVERDWHCYKPNPKFDQVAAVYEMVDIIHFACTAVLMYGYNPDYCYGEDILPTPGIDLAALEEQYSYFMIDEFTPSSLASFLGIAISYLGITPDMYLAAHKRKNERNLQRAKGGVMTGGYDKTLEVPLTLDFDV